MAAGVVAAVAPRQLSIAWTGSVTVWHDEWRVDRHHPVPLQRLETGCYFLHSRVIDSVHSNHSPY